MLIKRIQTTYNYSLLRTPVGCKGHCKVIEELLNSKADVNAKDSDGDTPLHLAAYNGYTVAVKMLLKRTQI